MRGSFVPPQEMRELRELTRYRKILIQQRANQCHRIQKLLETCNIKLASVATDILGVSGRQMLQALTEGEVDPEQLAQSARGRLRKKIPQLVSALEGVMSDHQRWLLGEELAEITRLEQAIARLDAQVEELTRPLAPLLAKLTKLPGVSPRVAEVIVAKMGVDMSRFPTAAHLASWAGICPGNRQSGKARPGNRWLKGTLTEAGWSAAGAKDTALNALYQRIARRRGAKRACPAVGHHLLARVHLLLASPDVAYRDPGPDYYQQRHKEQLKQHLLRKLRELGVNVTVNDQAA